MAEMTDQQLNVKGMEYAVNQGNGDIPGQSLTNSPDQPYAWEQPPQLTEVGPALNVIFLELTEPEAYQNILQMLKKDVPIGDITNIILYKGFTQGLWNPDLALLLIEPIMYMLIAIASKAGIQDPVIDDEPDEMEIGEQQSELDKAINMVKDKVVPKAASGQIPEEIVERVASLPEQPSLLEPTQNMPEQNSLLGRGE